MTYEVLAEALMGMSWQDRIFQVFGLMCYVATSQMPTAEQLRTVLKAVQRDLEQFTFRGGGGPNSISGADGFVRQYDFLDDLYYPVIRVTARRASGNSLPGQALEYFTPEMEPATFQQLDEFIIGLHNLNDVQINDLIDKTNWVWDKSIVIQ